ncbi:MAG: YidB family protein [Rubrivivax sp.]|nr:YidB family protein [Rubrivivax sp.]
MGLLDSVIGSLGQGGGGHNNIQAQLIQAVLAMMMNGGPSGAAPAAGGGLGGLGGLLGKLQQGGLGDIAASWVGSGPNAPVSAGQLEGALGGDLLGALAQQLGIGQQEVAGHLSQVLPQLVDGMTPDGQVPQGHAMPDVGQLDDLLGGLLGRR